MSVNGVLDTLRRFMAESGMDEQIDLRALQCVGFAVDESRILRVWFNDGRIRDWDARPFVSGCTGRAACLADAGEFIRAATVWDGAPGFDLGGFHDPADRIDFDPYEVWVEAKDVTRGVLEAESAGIVYTYAGQRDSERAAEHVCAYDSAT